MATKKMNIRKLQKEIRAALGSSFSKKDEIALSILCNTVKAYNECVDDIEEKGLVLKEERWVGKNKNEVSKPNPHVQLSISLQSQILSLLKEFNMTPRSRKDAGGKEPSKPEGGEKIKEVKGKISRAKDEKKTVEVDL